MTINENTKYFVRPNLKREANKTTSFMLPAIDLNTDRTGANVLRYFGFVNCYISHKEGLKNEEDTVCLVFNPSSDALKKFSGFYRVYKTYPTFVDDYMVDFNLIVLVFRVKAKWRNSYTEFKRSRYSQMSKEYADMFKVADFSGRVTASSEYYIINKHKDYKALLEEKLDSKIDSSAELASPLDMEQEIFYYGTNNNTKSGTTEIQLRES